MTNRTSLLGALSLALVYTISGIEPMQESPVQDAVTETRAIPSDVATPDALIAALYDVISGPPGKRDWPRMRGLFQPEARMTATRVMKDGTIRVRSFTVEDYIKSSGPYLEREGFFEKEIHRKADAFGHIYQAFSTYESRHRAEDEKPFARGINSIQLVNDGKRWWLHAILWDEESEVQPIPEGYLTR